MGTLRAGKLEDQISRTQFRAKSGLAFVTNEIGEAEGDWDTVASGKTQATMLATRSESWFWPVDGVGIAGKDSGSDEDFAWQQGILQPCWQHAGTGDFAQHAGNGVCASRNGVPASTKLQMMASASFIAANMTSFGLFN